MPPRRAQRLEDEEHPASKALQQSQKQKKPQTQPKKKPVAHKRPTNTNAVEPVEAQAPPIEEKPSSAANSTAAPVRKSKRQQREEEELAGLAVAFVPESSDDDNDGDDDVEVPVRVSTSAFASLQLDDDIESSNKSGKKRKKKKVSTTTADAPKDSLDQIQDDESHPLIVKPKSQRQHVVHVQDSISPAEQVAAQDLAARNAKPKKKEALSSSDKKDRKKQKKRKVDDFEAALAELTQRSRGSAPPGKTATFKHVEGPIPGSRAAKLCELLSVSLKDLDAATELKKFFGARAIAAASSSSIPSGSRSNRLRPAKGVLVQPQAGWPQSALRSGLGLTTSDADDEVIRQQDEQWWSSTTRGEKAELSQSERLWTISFDAAYLADTFRFVEAVRTMDPQNLVDLLQRSPWQADTLLQVSDYYRHRDEHAPASELVERAIFSFERALAPGPSRFASGRDRLDFRFAENRTLFLALSRHVVNLIRRGVTRAGFETAKFLLALDPWNDPHCALLQLDFLAVKTGQTKWLLDIWDAWPEGIQRWPGFWYARVLCLTDEEKRKDALHEAVANFPEVLPLLADKADVNLPPAVLSLSQFQIELGPVGSATTSLVHLLAHVYADRSADLWKDPSHSALLASLNDPATLPPVRARAFTYDERTQEAVFRHVGQFEAKRSWQGFIPQRIRARMGYAWDPLPPWNQPGSTAYNTEFFGALSDSNSAHLGREVSEAALLGHLRGIWAQAPVLADMFPDPQAFANMLRNAPGEAVQILEQARMQVLAQQEQQQQRHRERDRDGQRAVLVNFPPADDDDNIPGLLDVSDSDSSDYDEDDDDDEDEEHEAEDAEEDGSEEEEEVDQRTLAGRIVQGLFGRWGGGAARPAGAAAPEAHAVDNDGRDSDID